MPFSRTRWSLPAAEGLYDPALEKDACGVGFLVDIQGRRRRQILDDARKLSERMEHRGATGADNDSGDGAGAMVGIPHEFYGKRARSGVRHY